MSNESNGAFPQVHRHHLGNLLPRVTNNPPAGMHIQMLLLHIQLQVPDFPRKVERPEVVAETEHWIEYHGGFSGIQLVSIGFHSLRPLIWTQDLAPRGVDGTGTFARIRCEVAIVGESW